jgi:hypothetical protein
MRSPDSPTLPRHTTIDIRGRGSRKGIGSGGASPFRAHTPRENLDDEIAITISRFIKNYAIISAILYIFICFLGVIYDDTVYVKTGVNPLLYFDITDFLLSGLRHPIIFLIPTIVTIGIILVGTVLGLHKYHTTAYYSISSASLLCIAGYITIHSANYKMEYCGQDVSITFNEKSASPTKPFEGMIYGSTNKVVFVEPRSPVDNDTPQDIIHAKLPKEIKKIEAVPFVTIKEIEFKNTRYNVSRDFQCKILYQ